MSAVGDAVDRVDHRVGDRIERWVRQHHRRRLGRLGRADALEPPVGSELWAPGDPGPSKGNAFEVLIDGERALPAIAAALRAAHSHVHIAGWHLTPEFPLLRGEDELRLREVLAELAERIDVRVLLWAGPPLPVFRPHRSDVRSVRDELRHGTNIRCELDARERTFHCHHEKLVIVDDEVAFVGGIDLTSLSGDRFDTRAHPADGGLGWHDVATRLEGPGAADVAEPSRQR
jgi:phosphatidylserine/phosphatidylglycerophosphate/cardiolipin synthase-like enzyme